jgi:hypothetical protein
VVDAHGGAWQGTASDLLNALQDVAPAAVRQPDGRPHSPDSLGQKLRRLGKSETTQAGLNIGFGSTKDKSHKRLVLLKKVSEVSEVSEVDLNPNSTAACASDTSSGDCGPAAQVADPQVKEKEGVANSSDTSDTSDTLFPGEPGSGEADGGEEGVAEWTR